MKLLNRKERLAEEMVERQQRDDLMEEAKVASAKIGAKANGLRHGDKGRDTVSNVY